MTCKKGECKDCGYWDNQGRKTTSCHYGPMQASTSPTYWCSKFVSRTEVEQAVVENKLESKRSRQAKAEAIDAAREALSKQPSQTSESVKVSEPMSVTEQPQSTQ